MIAGHPIAGRPIAARSSPVAPGTIVQSSRFNNTNTFYAGSVIFEQGVEQSSRFDNTNTFYAGAVTSLWSITQSSRFNNTNVFYAGAVTGGSIVAGADLLVPLLRRRRR